MKIRWQSELQLDRSRIVEFLREFGDILPSALSERLYLDVYPKKVLAQANIVVAFIEDSSGECPRPLLTRPPYSITHFRNRRGLFMIQNA